VRESPQGSCVTTRQAGWGELRLELRRIDARRSCDCLDQLQNADFNTSSDVVLAVRKLIGGGCGDIGRDNVGDEDEVAGLPAVTVDDRPARPTAL
jgi:hypothetical protein